MRTDADPTVEGATAKRRHWRWRLRGTRMLFLLVTAGAIGGAILLAGVLRGALSTPSVDDASLLAAADGPPRMFAFLDSALVNDDLAQITDRLPPPGSSSASATGQVRARRLLALLDALDQRHELLTLNAPPDWRTISTGTVIRFVTRWPGPESRSGTTHLVLGGAHVVVPRARDLSDWRPARGQTVTVLAQTAGRLVEPGTVKLRPLAVYPR